MIQTVSRTHPLLPGLVVRRGCSPCVFPKASFSSGNLGSGNVGEGEGQGWHNPTISVPHSLDLGSMWQAPNIPVGSFCDEATKSSALLGPTRTPAALTKPPLTGWAVSSTPQGGDSRTRDAACCCLMCAEMTDVGG